MTDLPASNAHIAVDPYTGVPLDPDQAIQLPAALTYGAGLPSEPEVVSSGVDDAVWVDQTDIDSNMSDLGQADPKNVKRATARRGSRGAKNGK